MRILTHHLTAIILALFISLLTAVSVLAHSISIIRTEPANGTLLAKSPAQVTAWFDEELDTTLSTMHLYDAVGRKVDGTEGSVDLNDPDHASLVMELTSPLEDGSYTVLWEVASASDQDVTQGSYRFSVGQISSDVREPQSNGLSVPVIVVIGMGVIIVAGAAFFMVKKDQTQEPTTGQVTD